MPTISEDQLSAWTAKAFQNEDTRRENTEKLIRGAITAHEFLSGLEIEVFAKGSYKNNTNVRRDSDVDVAVQYTGISFHGYSPDTGRDAVWARRGINPYTGPLLKDVPGSMDIDRFKDSIGEALVGAFGAAAVSRSNKVFTARESNRSLAADVIPCVTYDHNFSVSSYARGIQLLADRPPRLSVVNYPHQHYQNGVMKNEATQRRFKRVVRILKNLENLMVAEGNSPEVPGYLVECLVSNCPDSCFNDSSWARRVRNVLVHIWEDTKEVECEKRWVEVNDIKFLFHSHQKWTRDEARSFAHAAWQYVRKS